MFPPGSKPPGSMDKKRSKTKKRIYPKKVQWVQDGKYITYNLNTNKKSVFDKPQGIGVNEGKTPQSTLKVIEKQFKQPKTKRVLLGGLLLRVQSPEIVTIKKNKQNLLGNIKFRFRR
tara:strand:+ start:538 stop:888 length:351 start_codon:yes stop_codon:yes gene_type:complete